MRRRLCYARLLRPGNLSFARLCTLASDNATGLTLQAEHGLGHRELEYLSLH